MSLKDWVPLPRYTSADPLSSLSFMERAVEAELHRLADDDGRIFVRGEPWEAIAKAGGASIGDRRMLRAILPTLITAGLVVRDGSYIVLTRRARPEPGASRPRTGREPGRVGVEPGSNGRESVANQNESVAKSGSSARNHGAVIDPPSCAGAGSVGREDKRRQEKREDPPLPPGGASEGEGDGEGKPPDTQRSVRGTEAPIVQAVLDELGKAGEGAAGMANVRFARQLAAYSSADGYTGPQSPEALLARVQRGVAGVAAAANTGSPMQHPGGYVLSKVLDPTGATAVKFTLAEGAARFTTYFARAWEKHRGAEYAAGPKDDEHALTCWGKAADNARKAATAAAAKGAWAPDEEEIIRWWVVCHFAKATTFLQEENWSMKTFASGIGGYGLPKQPRDPAAASGPRSPTTTSTFTLAPLGVTAAIGVGLPMTDAGVRPRSAS